MRIVRTGMLALLVTAACARPDAAPAAPLRLEAVAAAWSAGASAATCEDAPGEADLPATFRTRSCAWPRLVRGREFGQVTGSAGTGGALHALRWERAVVDSAAAARLADSLATALRAHGLTEYACPNAGRRWQAPELTVQLTPGVVHADGLLRVAVFATTLPNAMPDLLCPNAPKLPAAGASPRRPAAT